MKQANEVTKQFAVSVDYFYCPLQYEQYKHDLERVYFLLRFPRAPMVKLISIILYTIKLIKVFYYVIYMYKKILRNIRK